MQALQVMKRARPSDVQAGRVVRIANGSYVDFDEWRSGSAQQRHAARLHALHDRIAPRLVLSHLSAAALHGLSCPGEFPDRVQVIDPERSRAQATANLTKHPGAGVPLRRRDTTRGRAVTDITSTAVDVALSEELRTSVPILDQVLARGVSREAFSERLEELQPLRGRTRAETAIALADARSGSVGESVGRVALHEIGVPRAVLQEEFRDANGFVGRVDFWYPDNGVVLEFDGAVKYRDPSMRGAGRTAADVVIDEKRREDRLRRVPGVRAVGRFGWPETNDRAALVDVVRATGLPVRRGTGRRARA